MKTWDVTQMEVAAVHNIWDTEPQTVLLLDWLQRHGSYHAGRDKTLLPAIIPTGTYGRRRIAALEKPSGLIQVDIDGKHQPETWPASAWDKLADYLGQQPWCAVSARSCGGNGVFCLVAVDLDTNEGHRVRAETAMEAVLEAATEVGLPVKLDAGVSNNAVSLRFPPVGDPWVNMEVEPLTVLSF
jgi:hypothetical protein